MLPGHADISLFKIEEADLDVILGIRPTPHIRPWFCHDQHSSFNSLTLLKDFIKYVHQHPLGQQNLVDSHHLAFQREAQSDLCSSEWTIWVLKQGHPLRNLFES